jgi:hypothetical protein
MLIPSVHLEIRNIKNTYFKMSIVDPKDVKNEKDSVQIYIIHAIVLLQSVLC